MTNNRRIKDLCNLEGWILQLDPAQRPEGIIPSQNDNVHCSKGHCLIRNQHSLGECLTPKRLKHQASQKQILGKDAQIQDSNSENC